MLLYNFCDRTFKDTWRRGVVLITTAQLHSTKSELRFCAGSNPAWHIGDNCTTSFNLAWTQVLRGFKPCSRRVGDSRWWRSLTMVPAGNKAKRLSSVNHTTKTIHHHTLDLWIHVLNDHFCQNNMFFSTTTLNRLVYPLYI